MNTALEDKSNLPLSCGMIVFARSLLAKTEAYVSVAPIAAFYQNIYLGVLILNLVSHNLSSTLRYNILTHGIGLKIELML